MRKFLLLLLFAGCFLTSFGRVIISRPVFPLPNNLIVGATNVISSQGIDLNYDGINDIYLTQIANSRFTPNIGYPSCPAGGSMDWMSDDVVFSLGNNLPAGSSIFYTGYYPWNSTAVISSSLTFNKTYQTSGFGMGPLGDFYRNGSLRSTTNPPPAGQCFGTYPGPWICQSGVLCAGSGYLGFKLKMNGFYYYGYVHFTANSSAPWYNIDYVAYESVPGFPITISNSTGYFAIPAAFNVIKGSLYYDINNNCTKDAGEPGIPNTRVFTSNSIYGGRSDANGNYEILVPNGTGTYNITADTNSFKLTCPASKYVSVTTSGINQTFTGKNLGFTGNPCSNLKISLSSDRRRRCFRSQTGVIYRNDGLVSASGVYVKIIMPPEVKAISSIPAWTSQSGDTLIYSIGTVSALSYGSIQIIDSVICGDESIRWKTVCTKAFISPKTYCYQSSWDLSDLTLTGQCLGNTYMAVIKNSGSGPMADSLSYRIYLDNTLIKTAKFKLLSQDTFKLMIPASGMAVRVEVEQQQYHPELRQRAIYAEGCGIAGQDSITKGVINNFTNDPSNIGQVSSCMVIRDSYDPNEKTATPEGNFIAKDQEITFTVRFQNTGSDTAYTVVIADTLNANLDPSTIETLGASHNYKFELTGKTTPRMAWIFGGINLLDSTTNEKASHGFVTFKAKMKPGLANGIQITNQADIYFDYNSSIRTNKIVRTIGNPYPDQTFALTSLNAPDSVCENSNAQIKINASGISLKYYWKKDGVAVPSITTDQFNILSADSTSEGEYKCMIKSLMDSIEVKKSIAVKFIPTILAQPVPMEICEGKSVYAGVIGRGTALNYQWYKNGTAIPGQISDSISYPSFSITGSGAYFCKIFNSCTFVNSNSVNLIANKYPVLISPDKDLCDGSFLDLSANVSDANSTTGIQSYWADAALSIPLNNASSLSNAGTYYILKISDKGCNDTSSLNLNFHPNPNTSAAAALSICQPGSIDLTSNVTPDPNVMGALEYYESNQFNPVATPSLVTQAGEYYIVETSGYGCKDTVQISVSFFTKPNTSAPSTLGICLPGSIDLTSNVTPDPNVMGALEYYESNQFNPVATPSVITQAGEYYIIETSGNGCKDTVQISVSFYTKPDLQITNSATLCSGQSADLTTLYEDLTNSTGTSSYYKDQINGLNTPNIVTEPAIYYVVKTTAQGCSDTTALQVSNGVCTGIQSNSVAGITVYPNPVLNYLTITPEQSMNLTIKVFDMKGNLLYSCNTDSKKELDFSEFIPGTYLVHIFSHNTSYTYSVVKN
jgi:uncharacterized repeat protein (TIGR01451 family)